MQVPTAPLIEFAVSDHSAPRRVQICPLTMSAAEGMTGGRTVAGGVEVDTTAVGDTTILVCATSGPVCPLKDIVCADPDVFVKVKADMYVP